MITCVRAYVCFSVSVYFEFTSEVIQKYSLIHMFFHLDEFSIIQSLIYFPIHFKIIFRLCFSFFNVHSTPNELCISEIYKK